MELLDEPLPGLLLIKPRVFSDNRGYFFESFNKEAYNKLGITTEFVQDNQSLSQKNIVRGLHFQRPPKAQAKLVRVIKGAVLDVAVDIRKDSPTYGQHFSIELNEDNFLSLFIPEGFAHGFATLADNTIFSYKCSNLYAPDCEGGILWNCPELAIPWNIENPILSDKDTKHSVFSQFQSPF